jgi:beta-glucanase (GH16 family)
MDRARVTKTVAAGVAAVGVALFGVVAAKELAPSSGESSNPLVTTFCSKFVPHMEASSYYQRWARQNPVELGQWTLYRDSICAGLQPAIPAITTDFGKALVDAGAMALEINPVPTPTTTTTTAPPPTTTTTPPTTTTTTPVPSGEPGPITGQGYHLAFEDNFDTLSSSWSRNIWYQSAAPSSDVFVSNGHLFLESRRADGYPDRNITTSLSSTNTRSFKQGYFEARMKWNGGKGSWPAFWLFSTHWRSTGTCPPLISELDVLEGQGTYPTFVNNALHRNTSGACGVVDGHVPATNFKDAGIGDLTQDFHTYAALWTATTITWYLDGVQTNTAPVFDSTDQDMFLILSQWEGGWSGAADSSTPDPLINEVDWVRVWQK